MIDHVIVMAASPGRRMEALTRTRSKAMLPIAGKPLIIHLMNAYYNAGVRRFTVVVGEREGDAALWLTQNWHADVKLQFAAQGHQRGTASTLFATRSYIDGAFIITSCDVLIPAEHVSELLTYFNRHADDVAALSLFYAPDEAAELAGVVLDPRGQVMYISEKPIGAHQDFQIALPVYAFTPEVLAYLDRVPLEEASGERVLSSAVQMMIDDGGLVGVMPTPSRLRLESPEDLLNANLHYLHGMEESHIAASVPSSVTIVPPVCIEPGVTIGLNSTIGPNVYIETGSVIGARTTLSNSIVLGRQINSDMTIDHQLIYDNV